MTTDTSRKNTIKHINSSCNSLNNIFWSSYSHKVVWLIYGKNRCNNIENTVHILLTLSYRKATDSNPWKIQISYKLSRFFSKVVIDHSLNNTKKSLGMKSFFLSFSFILLPLFFLFWRYHP